MTKEHKRLSLPKVQQNLEWQLSESKKSLNKHTYTLI